MPRKYPTLNTYESGADAGELLLDLFDEIKEPGRAKDRIDRNATEKVLQQIYVGKGLKPRVNPELTEFLSTVLAKQAYETSIMVLLGTDDLIERQKAEHPICEVQERFGLMQFGFWTGDFGDGDAWCYDMKMDLIRCVPFTCGDENDLLDRTYGVFDNFYYLVAHLRCSCQLRGWV